MLASIRCIAKVAAKEEDHRCPTRAKNFVQIPQGPTLTHSHFLHDTRSLSACVRVCVCVHGCVRSEREWVQRKVFLLNLFSVSEDSAPTCTLSLSLSHLLTKSIYLSICPFFSIPSMDVLLTFSCLSFISSKAFPSWTTTMTILTETFIHVNKPE